MMTVKYRLALLILLPVWLLTACGSGAIEPVSLESTPLVPVTDMAEDATPGAGQQNRADEPEGGEVPENLFELVLQDLIARTGGERSSVSVIRAEAITWSDGSLGCPQPDMVYTQALVDGYQVIFSLHGEQYDYHLSENGQFVLCDNGLTDRFSTP